MLRAVELGQKEQRHFAQSFVEKDKKKFGHHVKLFSTVHKEANRPTKKRQKNDKASGGKRKRFSNGTAYTI